MLLPPQLLVLLFQQVNLPEDLVEVELHLVIGCSVGQPQLALSGIRLGNLRLGFSKPFSKLFNLLTQLCIRILLVLQLSLEPAVLLFD